MDGGFFVEGSGERARRLMNKRLGLAEEADEEGEGENVESGARKTDDEEVISATMPLASGDSGQTQTQSLHTAVEQRIALEK